MPVQIRFSFFGQDQILATLWRIRNNIGDLRTGFNNVGDYLAAVNKRHFDTEGESGASGKWAPLSPKYAAWKEKHYPGKPILRRTDALYKGLTERPMAVESITATTAVFGTDRFYAAIHQRGGWVSGWPPERPVIALTQADKDVIVKILQQAIVYNERALKGTPAYAPGDPL